MQPGGIIDLAVFLCPYVLPAGAEGDGGWSFVQNAHEPLLTSYGHLGDEGGLIVAPGVTDYGVIENIFVGLGDNTTDYDGYTLCQAVATSGHFGDNGNIQFFQAPLANAGGIEGKVQPNTLYGSEQFPSDLPFPPGFSPGSPNGYILKTMALGPTSFLDSHFQEINFAFPYTQYGYFNAFLSTPSFGSNWNVQNTSAMIGCNSYANFGEYEGESRTNTQGLLLAANDSAYPSKALFYQYGGNGIYQGAWNVTNYIEGVNAGGGRNLDLQGINVFLPDPTDPVALAAWYNGDIRASKNWFFMIAGQYFDGQPQTPLFIDVINQVYYPVRLHGDIPETQALIAAGGGMDLAYSEKHGAMFFVNGTLENPKWIFSTLALTLNFAAPYGKVPMIKLPCYNPCVPNIIAGAQP